MAMTVSLIVYWITIISNQPTSYKGIMLTHTACQPLYNSKQFSAGPSANTPYFICILIH